MEVMAYLLRKAEQCRRLAAEFLNQDDPAVKNLIALAADFRLGGRVKCGALDHAESFWNGLSSNLRPCPGHSCFVCDLFAERVAASFKFGDQVF
jgi:hypothetical protein